MPVVGWIVIGIVGLAVLALVVPPYLRERAKAAIADRCAALRTRIAVLRTQGGDTSEAQRLEAELDLCVEEAQAAGVDIDAGAISLSNCTAMQTQIEQEWTHYKSTATEDLVKRNNARGQVLRLGEDLARCLAAAVEESDDPPRLRAVRVQVQRAIASSALRVACFRDSGPGCSRYGYNEPELAEKERDERTRVHTPLKAVLETLDAKLAKVDASFATDRASEKRAEGLRRMREAARSLRIQGRIPEAEMIERNIALAEAA